VSLRLIRLSARNCANLVVESNARKSTDAHGNVVVVGRNLELLLRYTERSPVVSFSTFGDILGGTNILETLCVTLTSYQGFDFMTTSEDRKAFAHMIQLTLLHLIFHPDYCLSRPSVAVISQEVVYRSQIFEPIFNEVRIDELNIFWLLHVVNHFKFHLKQRREGILEHVYRALAKDSLPRAWTGILKNETTKLGKKWKGATREQPETLVRLRLIEWTVFLDKSETVSIRSMPDLLRNGTIWVDQVGDGNDGFQVIGSL
jgi:hypothetical protein